MQARFEDQEIETTSLQRPFLLLENSFLLAFLRHSL
jgi:hypothetical protein